MTSRDPRSSPKEQEMLIIYCKFHALSDIERSSELLQGRVTDDNMLQTPRIERHRAIPDRDRLMRSVSLKRRWLNFPHPASFPQASRNQKSLWRPQGLFPGTPGREGSLGQLKSLTSLYNEGWGEPGTIKIIDFLT